MVAFKKKKFSSHKKGKFLPKNGINSIFYKVPYLLVYFTCIMNAAYLPSSLEDIVLSSSLNYFVASVLYKV